jgi:adenylate cyclase
MTEQLENQEVWRSIFETGNPDLKGLQKHYNRLPSSPRCRLCSLPFKGMGGLWMRYVRKKYRSERNRHYCNTCNSFILAKPGGAEVTMSVLFVDIRNSSKIAEKLDPALFAGIIQRFTRITATTLADEDGFIFKFSGDAIGTVYPPGFLGPAYARRGIAGAERLLRTAMPRTPDGGELSIGIGVHTGLTYIGTLHSHYRNDDEDRWDRSHEEGVLDNVQPLGVVPNVASHLSDHASPGEALISESTLLAAGYKPGGLQLRQILLKGETTVPAYAITRDSAPLRE